jgi:phage shock protein A
MQRAEDKVAQMQARSGALDELMASGALDDASMSSDRLQAELDRGFAEPAVEAELARLKGELPGASTTAKQLDAPAEASLAEVEADAPTSAPRRRPSAPAEDATESPAKAPAEAPAKDDAPVEEERR